MTKQNDRRVRARDASTYVDHVHDDSGGRFAKHPSTVIGAQPVVEYPAAATWTRNRLPDELPLGIDINAQEPVGTHAEIEQSLRSPHPNRKPAMHRSLK